MQNFALAELVVSIGLMRMFGKEDSILFKLWLWLQNGAVLETGDSVSGLPPQIPVYLRKIRTYCILMDRDLYAVM
jgi:hypothetical protein